MPTEFWPIAALAGEFALRLGLIAYILVRRPMRSTSNLAWIAVILSVPLIGAAGYLLLGEPRLGRRRVARHAEIRERLHRPAASALPVAEHTQRTPPHFQPIATLAEAVGENAPVGGNRLQLIGDADIFVDALVGDIEDATSHCHLLFYIFLDDRSGRLVAEALARAAGRGVECRVLIDAVGSRSLRKSKARRTMEHAGVRVVEALPANAIRMLFARLDLRNHRKIVVIDGRVGYVGSQNLADADFAPKPKYAPWVDAMVRIDGPATHDLQVLFAEDWFLDTGESLERLMDTVTTPHDDGMTTQVMGTGPNSVNQALRQLHGAAFQAAREELILTTPYFVPDEATSFALRGAARRGVETTLIVPARNDSPLVAAASRSHYEPLLTAGVRIFEYEAGLLHAKTISVDRSLAIMTTGNMDRRSVELNFEASLVVFDGDFASELRFMQTSYLARSRAVDLGRWNRRSIPARLWQNSAGTLAPLL
jgi:cardiolipin synthase